MTAKRKLRLLFADDEPSLQELMRLELPRLGHEVTVCPDGTVARNLLEEKAFDCILVDLDMPGATGLEVIERAKAISPEVEAIILTGKSSLDSAISALRNGVFDYLTKPCRLVEIESVLNRVAEKIELTRRYRALKRRLERIEGSSDLIGDSEPMQKVRSLIDRVAPTESTVLILGETGTGKELVARAIHDRSLRAEGAFVPVNCGALPETLIESELFGHSKGAFTGADEPRIGLIEVADGGTLFLDEIGELPMAVQAKLLRFLESGEIRRLGENRPIRCDVRVVSATHRPLETMVAEGTFREDLWYRVNTFEIALPALRERDTDIEQLALLMVARHAKSDPADIRIADETLKLLVAYRWPGNVRELSNLIEHGLILRDEGPLLPEHLPMRFQRATAGNGPSTASIDSSSVSKSWTLGKTLGELELQAIFDALDYFSGNKTKTAESLGVSLKTLYNKINQAETGRKIA
jgi:DNA-binding NtrC family response regulator